MFDQLSFFKRPAIFQFSCELLRSSPENWSSPSLRSGEALNLSTLRYDKFIFGFDSVSAKTVNSTKNCHNTALYTSDKQKVEGYLSWKWGLEGKLPSTHPYYSSRP